MKIIHCNDSVNFVDMLNVFVGYDTAQDCCEHADWFISEKFEYTEVCGESGVDEAIDLEPYLIDPEFKEGNAEDLDVGGHAVFKLVGLGEPNLYLHLFNCQNGYYSHGLVVKINDETIYEDVI